MFLLKELVLWERTALKQKAFTGHTVTSTLASELMRINALSNIQWMCVSGLWGCGCVGLRRCVFSVWVLCVSSIIFLYLWVCVCVCNETPNFQSQHADSSKSVCLALKSSLSRREARRDGATRSPSGRPNEDAALTSSTLWGTPYSCIHTSRYMHECIVTNSSASCEQYSCCLGKIWDSVKIKKSAK